MSNLAVKELAPEVQPETLIALTPIELKAAQGKLTDWCNLKIQQLADELQELHVQLELVKRRKWKVTGLGKQVELTEQRMRFYGKVRLAVEHGYLVIPDFPVTTFAVRIASEVPPRARYTQEPSVGDIDFAADVTSERLSADEGRYVAPVPATKWGGTKQSGTDKEGKPIFEDYWITCGFREWQFPVKLARPKLIDATKQAIALRVFDEIGLVGPRRKGDPIIVGRILRPISSSRYDTDGLNFYIAWWMDWEML